MAISKSGIERWLQEGKKQGATHVIVVCDTFDYEDYPVYVMPTEDVNERRLQYTGKNMQRVMEVYSLTGTHSIEAQLDEHRAWHFD